MFWPEADRNSAHALMRTHLWALRSAGLGPWLSFEGEMVELREGEGLWIDVREHRRLLGLAGLGPGRRGVLSSQAEPSLSEAVEICQGPFLAGFHLSDSVAFDEWQLHEEEALRTSLGTALDALTRLREERGDMEGAVDSASRRLDLDPLDERCLRALMTLYKRMGRRQEALLCYERASKLLQRELELTPARETTLLRNQILARGPEDVEPTPASVAPSLIVLPDPSTRFVGREDELQDIARHLDEPGLRLLTLTGPGGCGKTRLAVEAGRTLSDRFPDGVVFVSLASVEAGYLLPAALAELWSLTLGARQRGPSAEGSASGGPFGELIGFLREKRMLIILDNLEQVTNDLGSLREILAGTRRPVFLATSRVRLRLAGEQVLEVEGLPWPERRAAPEELLRSPSVCLFLQAVRRVRSLSNPSPGEMQAAGEICRRLRGHPLGVELAASWASCLGVVDIAAQLADTLDLEAAPRFDIPPRHRSLRAVFAQSWALLSAEERAAFRRLSLSPGSFDRGAALDVGRTTPGVLASLIEQSFLRRTRDRRFEILESLRQFGREKLSLRARDEAAVADRAARFYLGRLVAARSSLEGPGQKKTLRGLTRDRHHLRFAWARAADRGWISELSKAVRPLFLFYDMSSRLTEGAEAFELAVRHLKRGGGRSGSTAASLRERRLLALSRVAQAWFTRLEDTDRCRRLMKQGLRDLSGVGKADERAFAEVYATIVGAASVDVDRVLREGAAHCEKIGDLWCAGLCWEILALRFTRSDPAEGFRAIQRSLALRRRGHDQWSVALGVYVLGLMLAERGLFHGARRRFEESLALRRRLRVDPDGVSTCLAAITVVALRAGVVEDARRHGGEALATARRTGSVWRIGLAQTCLVQAHYLGGTSAEARPLVDAALAIAGETSESEWSSHLYVLSGLLSLDLGEEGEAQWSLDRAVSAWAPTEHPESNTTTLYDLLEGWPALWRDLLEARLALDRGEWDACGRAFRRVLAQVSVRHHHPLLAEALAVWVEWSVRAGRPFSAGRLTSALAVCSVLPERRRIRLESLLRGVEADAQTAPADAATAPPAASRCPAAAGSRNTLLLTLAAEVLSAEQATG